ncbi:multidrug effflux MFS transporter [Marinomonas transparens]|uniref:Bcr/CflA family efflux transporter n=1 Tax=Marinomonas transparens TaxID=2795388 RepID=A0A934N813_9GAMM|nr:multidrug effflux MFS transporter [Marinomonas transparens]MBJ7539606.1 multidrug effflux MFS transporter [Marinomonas transparens]
MTQIKTHSKLMIPLLGYLVSFGPLSIDMYLPSLPTIANNLGSSQVTIQYTITTFLFGMAIGMLFFGPMSDLLGRKKLLLIGTAFYLFSSIGCALVNDGESLILLRFFQSLGAAAAGVLGRALVRDFFPLDKAAGILSNMHIISMAVMLMSPILGAYIVTWLNWRWIFYFLSTLSFLALIGIFFIIQEPQKNHATNKTSFRAYLAIYGECLSNKKVSFYMLANGFSFGGMFAFIAASAFVYIDFFSFTETTYAVIFSANVAMVIAATFINKSLVSKFTLYKALRMTCITSLSAGLMILITALFFPTSALLFIAVTMLYISVTGAIGANSLACLFELMPSRAGTMAGLLVSMQFIVGGIVSAVTSLVFDGSASSLLVVMGVCGGLSYMFHGLSQRD